MSAPAGSTAQPRRANGLPGRIAVAVLLSGVVFLVLWMTALSLVTSLLIGSGVAVVVIAASAASDLFEAVLDVMASAMLAVLGAIAAIIGAVFSLFGN